jgi:hypothetical protein
MKTEILFLAEDLLNFQFHIFFPLGMVLKQLSLEATSWPILVILKKIKMQKKLDQFAVSKLKLFQNNNQ